METCDYPKGQVGTHRTRTSSHAQTCHPARTWAQGAAFCAAISLDQGAVTHSRHVETVTKADPAKI